MPPSRAPRRKSCQALLPDGETPCSATFRGWGRYCQPHLEESAKLSGQYKDAAAKTERLRRQGELSERQVRGLLNTTMVDRAVERVQQYAVALEDEVRARGELYRRFPAEKDERHEQRLAVLEERKAACAALILQLQQRKDEIVATTQQRRERYVGSSPGGGSSPVVRTGDSESQPLIADESRRHWRRNPGCMRYALCILFFFMLLGVMPAALAYILLNRKFVGAVELRGVRENLTMRV